jgi:hypothetical protein
LGGFTTVVTVRLGEVAGVGDAVGVKVADGACAVVIAKFAVRKKRSMSRVGIERLFNMRSPWFES